MSHPIYIDDVSLKGLRDRLLWLVEGTWPEIGLTLDKAKTVEDLCYPARWEDHRESLPVVRALLRSPERRCRVDADGLYKMRKGLVRIHQAIKDAYDNENVCRERLTKVDAALAQEMTPEQQVWVTEKRKERVQALADATAQRRVWDNRQRKADAALRNCEAQFARTEILKFRKNRRYNKNPLNTANALAGLPFIGWRQSIKRCQKWKPVLGVGHTTQLLRVVRRIVESWNPQKLPLREHVSVWLQHGYRYYEKAQAELRKEFFYLARAIDAALKNAPRRKFLPYLITSEYQKRISNRSAVDRLFEDEERIELNPKKKVQLESQNKSEQGNISNDNASDDK